MATRRPNAVVMRASAIPPPIAARPPEPDCAIPVNEFTTPIVVPSSPTNGAVAPTVASTARPRFRFVISRSMLRSTARAAEHQRDVRLLVALGESDGFGEVVFLEELRVLGGELDRFLLRLSQIPPLRDHDREGVDGHHRHHDHDALGEVAHLVP